MADGSVIVDGKIKFREGKKWKPRWCILKRLSPVADNLQVVLYKDVAESRKVDGKPKQVLSLNGFFGLNAGFMHDREPFVMAILCEDSVSLMAFECRDYMIQFEIKIRQCFGEEHQFPVKVVKAPSSSRLPKDQIMLMIHNQKLCLVVMCPPKVLLIWNICDLRRFGVQSGKFCFEGGDRCGKGSGVFAFQSEQAEDIADIVHLASTGKTSNCHRKFKNRSSQIEFGSHLMTDLSSSPSPSSVYEHNNTSHNTSTDRAIPHGPLPVNLNCCHGNQSNSAESEDWSWYKRHSVSVTDYRRIAALHEGRHMERSDQLASSIYDIPPNNGPVANKQGCTPGEPLYDLPNPEANLSAISSSSHQFGASDVSNIKSKSYPRDQPNYAKITPKCKPSEVSDEHIQATMNGMWQLKKPAGDVAGRLDVNDGTATISHEMSLQNLKKQESDLEREMKLLDEMLRNCANQSDNLIHSLQYGHCANGSESQSETASYSKDGNIPVVSGRDNDFVIISGNVARSETVQGKEDYSKMKDKKMSMRLNSSLPEGSALSPLFHAKLNNIPPTSRLNKPLPYINLSKYDDESYSHVHLPSSADCVPTMWSSSPQNESLARGPLGLKVHSSSLSNLPVTGASSVYKKKTDCSGIDENDVWKRQYHTPSSKPVPLQKFQTGHIIHKMNPLQEQQEVLFVDMNSDSNVCEQHEGYSLLLDASTKSQDVSVDKNSEIISILTADVGSTVRDTSDQLYENLASLRAPTPPPRLPPKGSALLKKLGKDKPPTVAPPRADRDKPVTVAPPRADRDKPVTVAPPRADRLLGSPKQPTRSLHINTVPNVPPELPTRNWEVLEVRSEACEGNYLLMGSPKLQSKFSAAPPPPNPRTVPPQFEAYKQQLAGHRRANRLDDYMDMAMAKAELLHEDEIYLDDPTDNLTDKDLYISEADLSLAMSRYNGRQPGRASEQDSLETSERIVKVATTPITIPVDIPSPKSNVNEASFGCNVVYVEPSQSKDDDAVEKCTNLSTTVLRPRSGAEYVLIHRRRVSNAGLPPSSPCNGQVFNFESLPLQAFSSQSLCQVKALHSPSISVTSQSMVSLPSESPRSDSRCSTLIVQDSTLHTRPLVTVTAVSPSPSPRQEKIQKTKHSLSPVRPRGNQDVFFFPIEESQSVESSPYLAHKDNRLLTARVPSPIYVNQEFIDRHRSSQSRSTTSSSPLRGGVHSIMSFFLKDSSKQRISTNSQTVIYRRNSAKSGEGNLGKSFKTSHSRSLTLPHSRKKNSSLSRDLHTSQREVRDVPEKSTLKPTFASQTLGKFDQNYEHFADSSIISRRRNLQAQSHTAVATTSHASAVPLTRHTSLRGKDNLSVPVTKSSGYKNIDSFGAAISLSSSVTPPCSELSKSRQSPQPPYSSPESHLVSQEQLKCTADENQCSQCVARPPTASPPPPLPRRRRLSSSPPSTPLSLERTPSMGSSDSPPSYFAPSPPSSPPGSDLPPLPPRRFPLSSQLLVPSTNNLSDVLPLSPDSSDDLTQQELNYILLDMTDVGKQSNRPEPPIAQRRRSKRARQHRGDDSAKSSYALIDFTSTRALQKTGEEHRDDSLRREYGTSTRTLQKAGHEHRTSGQLNRINSLPSSTGKKPLSLVTRERKLSTGSTESC